MEAEWQERIRKHFAELAEAIIGTQDHIVYLTKERDELRTELAAVTADRDSLRQQCEAMATEIDAKQRELDEVKARLEEATGWINVNFSTGEWTA